MSLRAIGYAGLPGSGKSTAAEIGRDLVGGSVISMGSEVRRAYDRADTDLDIGSWASRQRQERGPEWVAYHTVCTVWSYPDDYPEPVHIEGIRSPEEVSVLEDHFGAFPVLYLETDSFARYNRLTERARDGEGEYDLDEFLTRDHREMGWGLARLHIDNDLHRVPNETTVDALEANVETALATTLTH